MEYQQISEIVHNLTSAQIWLLLAVLVFVVCSVLTLISFRQFSKHQSIFVGEEAPARKTRVVLIDTDNITSTPRYILSEKTLMIGRVAAKDTDVYDSATIADVTIGRRHAVIEFEEGAYWLQDQGSVNGTFVNGQRIEQRYRLRDGDQVRIHKFSFQFIIEFLHGHDYVRDELDLDKTIPQILRTAELSTKPNDVLINYAEREESLLEIPRSQVEQAGGHQRTQVLFRNDMEGELAKSRSKSRDQSDREIRRDIQDLTVQLFKSQDDDRTLRLYSDLLDGPPVTRPNYKPVEKEAIQKESVIPVMDERKVIEALDDFFSDTEDDVLAQVEITKKGNKLAKLEEFASPFRGNELKKETP